MRTILIPIALVAAAVPAAYAEKLGDHPALIARRVIAAQGYDYEAKFYPHPAWLYLAAQAPRPMMDHPAVIVAKRERERVLREQREALARAAAMLGGAPAER
jgi:hypothetical protein